MRNPPTSLLQFSYPTEIEECEKVATDWNFIGAQVPHEEPEVSLWTTGEEGSISDSMSFVQIIEEGDSAVLIWDNVAYPSTGPETDGSWTFEWVGKETYTYSANHFIGYTCSQDFRYTNTTTFALTVEGDQMVGTLTFGDDEVEIYEESDIWSKNEDGVEQCGIPSSSYLESFSSTSKFVGTTNEQLETDCSGITCTLKVEQHCAMSYDFSGTNIGYGEESAYDNVDDAGHGFGLESSAI